MMTDDSSVLTAPHWASLWLRGTGGMTVDFSISDAGWPSPDEEREVFVNARAPGFEALYDWRPITGADLTDLGQWLDLVVTHDFPETSVPALSLPRPGLVMDVVASDITRLTVQFTTVGFPDDPEAFSFDTTLIALRHTATQIAAGGFDDDIRPSMRLYGASQVGFQSLIWASVRLPEGSQLNGVAITDDDHLEPPGHMAMLRGFAFDPDCDAELELDRLRVYTPGAVATLLGTLPSGERFGVLVQQSLPYMDEDWLGRWSGEVPIGVGGVPGDDPCDWWTAAGRDDLDDLRDFHILQFGEAEQWAEEDAQFLQSTGSSWLPYTAIAEHLSEAYGDATLIAALSGEAPVPPLRTVLRRLLGEAVGIPLPRMLSTDGCVLPGWDHTCRYDAVQDALTAWQERRVAPEQFNEFLIKDTTSTGLARRNPADAAEMVPVVLESHHDWHAAAPDTVSPPEELPGGFASRFASILGSESQAPASVRTLFDLAHKADRSASDEGEMVALERAWRAAQRLLDGGVPRSHRDGVLELTEQLGLIFEEFSDDS